MPAPYVGPSSISCWCLFTILAVLTLLRLRFALVEWTLLACEILTMSSSFIALTVSALKPQFLHHSQHGRCTLIECRNSLHGCSFWTLGPCNQVEACVGILSASMLHCHWTSGDTQGWASYGDHSKDQYLEHWRKQTSRLNCYTDRVSSHCQR